ncbi:serine hydrolase domain-containing protein [Arthrobacter sp. 135MFCol5.1]|uniref:serine hydrolase domain-containing protein n=1 Tax=Arthrobacter sp. 135MFCol5.1 TaxID=1158050 RepID=UPI00037992F4|nr:serine hydrolase domain-containing protein [Arthrobacter sp. 135MFCol5.1]
MGSKNRIVRRAALAVALSVSGCTYTDDPLPPGTFPPALEPMVQQIQLFLNQGAVSAVVQVRWPGGEWSQAFGVRDLDSLDPAQPTDRVEIAGVTQAMTAVAVLRLVDDHLIGLDDPVIDAVPELAGLLRPPGPLTVRQLLSHTSGMPDAATALPHDVDFRPALSQALDLEQQVQAAGTLPWRASDVGLFTYSTTDYVVLGLVVEALRHKPFAQVMLEQVFSPLGLKDSTLDRPDARAPNILHGYVTLHGERIDTTDDASVAGSPASGVVSTVADLNRFMAALLQGRAVSPSSLREMKTSPGFGRFGLGLWRFADQCSPAMRQEGKGSFRDFQTVAVSSDDGRYQAAMTVTAPPMPGEVEDPASTGRRDLLNGQIESTLNEALDRLCQPAR